MRVCVRVRVAHVVCTHACARILTLDPPSSRWQTQHARALTHTCTCAHALEQKADVNVAGMVNGFTPLFAACENNDLVRSTRNA